MTIRQRKLRRALREWPVDLLLVATSGIVIIGILRGVL